MKQLALFDKRIIVKICDAKERYIGKQQSCGRWVDGKGWEYCDGIPDYVYPKVLYLNERDLGLLKAFFNVSADVKNYSFWGCEVKVKECFLPNFA